MDVVFIRVSDNKSKLSHLTHIIHSHFLKGERICIHVLDQSAADYVDELLWRTPEESFLPHCIANNRCRDTIMITLGKENHNDASILFNLHPEAHPNYIQYKTIYELFDETHPSKTVLSQKRLEFYPSHRFYSQMEDV